jgi:hypothetical protein
MLHEGSSHIFPFYLLTISLISLLVTCEVFWEHNAHPNRASTCSYIQELDGDQVTHILKIGKRWMKVVTVTIYFITGREAADTHWIRELVCSIAGLAVTAENCPCWESNPGHPASQLVNLLAVPARCALE